MTQVQLKPSMGVLKLHQQVEANRFRLVRYAPSEEIGFFVKHYWIVSWDLTAAGDEPFLQEVVPNPCVNLVVERGKSAIFAPAKQRHAHYIEGKGTVFGVKFKPGGFYPFVKTAISGMAEHPLGLHEVFGAEARETEHAFLTEANGDERMVELAEAMIRPKLPVPDENVTLINRIVDQVCEDRTLTKVDELCESFDLNKRKLQRLFEQYVGVSPKWMIRLYRIQNAAEAIDLGEEHDWLQLSLKLGYYDQAHFTKDFKLLVGKTPEEYGRKQAAIHDPA
ncbi:helix-turn-helix domain-containing protein [Paenibacillus koleovorans]|uniref:helix-turn-helix domain-containing protein n=1 Tax=Paenibacillus koleovorans TaxID=121608 RepID=UPI001FE276D9|nr:AraC family transcriptional regulator [Paenibacillus koleovorans]